MVGNDASIHLHEARCFRSAIVVFGEAPNLGEACAKDTHDWSASWGWVLLSDCSGNQDSLKI